MVKIFLRIAKLHKQIMIFFASLKNFEQFIVIQIFNRRYLDKNIYNPYIKLLDELGKIIAKTAGVILKCFWFMLA